jgi:ribonuclease R
LELIQKILLLLKKIFNPRAKFKAKVFQILKKANHSILCYIKDNKSFCLKDDVEIKADLVNLAQNDVVLIENSKVVKIIGSFNDPKIDEKISTILYKEDYRLKPFDSFEISSPDMSNREDLRDLNFCTIDPPGAKDFDDAIYFDQKNYILYVAIADVSAYIDQNSPLDMEAKKRAFSIYLPHKVLPMLPFELSNELCSLKPNEDRLAYTFKIFLDPNSLEVKKSELFESIINSKQRFTYGRIDRVLDNKLDQYNDTQKIIFDNLLALYDITKKLKEKRLEKGFDFRSDEYNLTLDSNHSLVSTSIEQSSPSHSLIEECMLLANVEAAKKLGNYGIYRVHDEPSPNAIKKLLDEAFYLGIKAKQKSDIHKTITTLQNKAKHTLYAKHIDEMIIHAQIQARYSPQRSPHFGLGFESYSHFTSPIRRYTDLALHRMLKTKNIPKDIDEICQNISTVERKINELVWDFEDRKYSRWAKENIGKTVKCELVDNERYIAESIKDIVGARIYLQNFRGEKLFSHLKVKITQVDLIAKKIFGEIC